MVNCNATKQSVELKVNTAGLCYLTVRAGSVITSHLADNEMFFPVGRKEDIFIAEKS